MKRRRVLLYVYSVFVFIFGIVCTPLKSTYEGNRLVEVVYAPIWKVRSTTKIFNDSALYYEVDIHRVFTVLLVFTLITAALYLVFNDESK